MEEVTSNEAIAVNDHMIIDYFDCRNIREVMTKFTPTKK